MTKSDLFSKEFLDSIGAIDFGYTEDSQSESFSIYDEWVRKGLHGPLKYLEDHRKDLRQDIKKLYPEFQSALVFVFPYIQEKKQLLQNNHSMKMASYAYAFEGYDYHYVLKEKLENVVDELKKSGLQFNYLDIIDTKPVLERDLAKRAGLGWIGKNSMLINRSYGSYFLIASLLLDQKLEIVRKQIEVDHCGNCTKCIDACPTSCILDNRTIDAGKCISTFTIEMFKDCEPPTGFNDSEYFFGCDICQDVCPWNNKPLLEAEILDYKTERQNFFNDFFLSQDKDKIIEKLEMMSNREFQRVFKGTSLFRTGRIGLIKNLKNLS